MDQIKTNPHPGSSLKLFLKAIEHIEDPRAAGLAAFHQQNEYALRTAKGSASKHQAWVGGYADHILQCLQLAGRYYETHILAEERFPFKLASAQIVLVLHDVEKMFKYAANPPPWYEQFNKWGFLHEELAVRWGVALSEDELHAIKYTHGEGDEYNPHERIMSPLAAFVHAIDVLSARVFYDRGPFLM